MLASEKSVETEAIEQVEAAIEAQRQILEERGAELEALQEELNAFQQAIEADAKVLEEQIRKLAKEEAEIQQRKRALQHEATAIGERRTDAMKRAKAIAKDREALKREAGQLEQRKAQIQLAAEEAAQQRAFEESTRAAQIEPMPTEPVGKIGAERRASKRVAVAVDVSFHTEHNFFMGLTENLSSGGLFVATYDDVPVGTKLKIKLGLPDQAPIEASGVVRWVREYTRFTQDVAPGVGVELIDLSDEAEQAIRSFLAQRDPIYYELP